MKVNLTLLEQTESLSGSLCLEKGQDWEPEDQFKSGGWNTPAVGFLLYKEPPMTYLESAQLLVTVHEGLSLGNPQNPAE